MPDITWDDEAPAGGVKWDTAPAPSSVTWDDEKPPANPVFAQHRAAKAKQEAEWAAVAEAAAPKPPTEDPVPSGILGSYENAYRSLIRPITGAVSDFAHKKFDEAFGAARQYAADPRVPAPVQAVAGATAGVGGLAEGMTTIDPVEIAKSVYELPQGVAESARQTGEAIGQGHVGQAVESGVGTLGMIGMGALIGKETLGRGMNRAVHVEGRDAMPPKFRRNPETGGLERYMGPEAWSRGEGWKPVEGPPADMPQSPEQVQARYEQVAAQPTLDEVRANMRGGEAIRERLQAPPPEPSPIIAGRPPADIAWDDALEGRKAAVRTAEQDIQLRDIERRAAERGYDASRETAAADAYARATQEAPPPEPEPVAAAAGVPEQAPPVPDRSPNDRVRALAREYNAGRGMPAPEEGVNLKAVEERARQVADAYESLKDQNLEDPAVKQAYEALANEVDAQWDAATRAGFKFEPWEREGQPYANSAEMMRDVRDNGHLYFFRGGEPHPFMSRIDPQTGLTSNDKFRAIHDLFGHAAEGYQFGPHGEESAWYRHSQMFSPEAQRAMSTETRGQNSWVNYGKQNYGPNGERLNIPMTERPYAKQKVDLLPVEMTDWKSARGESLPEPLAREVMAAKARLEKLRQAGADQTGSILHKNTGEELDTTSDHVRTLAAAILWRADGRELSLKAFDRQMRKEFGKNVYRVTERGGQYDLTPEQAMHGGVVKLAELTVRAAERGDTGKITPHKDIKRRTDAGVAMGATEWYERGMKELAAELGLDVTKRISRFETGYSPRKRVQFSILRAVDATIREAEGKLPRTNNFDHKTVMSAYVNDPVTGQKLTPYDASKAAALGGPEPRTTVVDTIMSKSAGFDEVVNESVQRFVDAVNRMETNRIGADKIQKAQAATWSGYQQEIGNEGATRSWAELVRDAIEKSGGIEAFKERVKEYYSDDTSFDTAAMDAKPTPQEIVLRHRSPKADLTELDPEFMGTNRPGTESRRADRPKAVYLNKEGVPFEPGLGTNEFEARTHIGPGGLYDDATDPLKLKERPRDMDLDRATQYQRDVIAAGYKGHIAEDGRVAYFDKLPVKRILGDQTGSLVRREIGEAERSKLKEEGKALREIMRPLAQKGDLTAEEGRTFHKAQRRLQEIIYDLGIKPVDTSLPQQPNSALTPEIVSVAHADLVKDRRVFMALSDAAGGTFHNADTAVDLIMRGKSDVSPREFYDTFDATREALRNKFGDTVTLYRATGSQMKKPTTNWATTEAYARQFGDNVIKREIPVDDILAVNVGHRGTYHELVVGDPPKPSDGATRERLLGDQTGSLIKKPAPGEPRENFDDTAARMGFLGRSGLRQLEKADPDLAAKFRKVPTIYHAGRDFVAGLSKTLLKEGVKFKDFATVLTESRLIGAQKRLRSLVSEVDKMTPTQALEDYESGLSDSMKEVVDALHQTPKGKVLKIKEGAEKAYNAGDGDALKAHLKQAFADAADNATRLMSDADFAKRSADPKFKKALAYYKSVIEPLLDAAHIANQGKRSPHLGPLDTFYPLSGIEKDSKQARITKRLLNLPKNPWDKFTTGLAKDYDLSTEALQKNIGVAMRANAMADALDASVDAKIMRKFNTNTASATFRWRGEDYKAAGAGRWIMPKWFKDEIAPILDGAHASWPNAKLQAVRDKLNWVALVGPFDFMYHGANVLGTSHKIPAFAYQSPVAKAIANLPIVGKMPAILVDMFRESTRAESFQKDVARLRDMGLLHDSYASETLSKKLAEESGIEYAGGDSKYALVRGAKKVGSAMGVSLYGPGGIDIRARVAFLRAADKMGLPPTEAYHFVNNLGNYVYQLNGDLARAVKKAGLSPFYTAGSTMGWNGMVQLLGTQRLPAKNTAARNAGIRLYQAINSGAIGALLVWAAHYKAETDKFPWEDPEHAKLFKVPVGENEDGSTRYMSIVDLAAPGLSRGARLTGVRGAAETLARGGTKGQAFDAAATDSINTMIHPLAGPLPSMAMRAAGWEPSLSSIYDDRYKKPRIQLRSRIGKAEPGIDELAERLKYAAGGVNPMIEKGAGTLDDEPKNAKPFSEMVRENFPPRLFTRGNPRKEAQRIRRAQR